MATALKFQICPTVFSMMGIFSSKTRTLNMESSDNILNQIESAGTTNCLGICKRNKDCDNLDDVAIMKHFGYDLFETIGRGAYAKVKRGYSGKLKRDVAIKIVDRKKAPSEFKRKFLPREVRIAFFARHDNIVRCYEILKAKETVYMVLEKVENGDLLRYVVNQNFVEEIRAKQITKGVVAAVKYLHEKSVAHRDLKLENILLDCNFNPKLSDFGFARNIEKQKLSCTYCGSAAYAPMEILSGTPYDPFKVDIWSLGVVIYSMTIGYMPFSESKQISKIKRGVSFRNVKQHPSKALQELILNILVNDPKKRPSPDEILNHDWLAARHVPLPRQQKSVSVNCDEFELKLNNNDVIS